MNKTVVSGPIFARFGPKHFSNGFYFEMLDIVASYYCMQFQGKLMNQTWENGEKTSFGTDFGLFGQKKSFHKLYLH